MLTQLLTMTTTNKFPSLVFDLVLLPLLCGLAHKVVQAKLSDLPLHPQADQHRLEDLDVPPALGKVGVAVAEVAAELGAGDGPRVVEAELGDPEAGAGARLALGQAAQDAVAAHHFGGAVAPTESVVAAQRAQRLHAGRVQVVKAFENVKNINTGRAKKLLPMKIKSKSLATLCE